MFVYGFPANERVVSLSSESNEDSLQPTQPASEKKIPYAAVRSVEAAMSERWGFAPVRQAVQVDIRLGR